MVCLKVTDYKSFFDWLDNTFVESFYGMNLYNGGSYWWSREFTADFQSIPVGAPRLRQLRSESGGCQVLVVFCLLQNMSNN